MLECGKIIINYIYVCSKTFNKIKLIAFKTCKKWVFSSYKLLITWSFEVTLTSASDILSCVLYKNTRITITVLISFELCQLSYNANFGSINKIRTYNHLCWRQFSEVTVNHCIVILLSLKCENNETSI